MSLIKTSLLSLIATIFKISYGLLINKLLAIYAGPAGVALVGQFQSLQQSLSGLATAGFGQGLTKYLAEFRGNTQKNGQVFSTAVKLVGLILLPLSLAVFLFSELISQTLFDTSIYDLWIKGLAISIVPSALGALLVASLNGLGEIRSLTMVGVLSSCLGIGLTALLVPLWGVQGVIVSLLSTPFLVLTMAAWYLKKSSYFSWRWLKENAQKDDARKLGKFTLMALASAIAIPASQIMIRNYLSDTISIDAAGIWTGLWRISEAYLMVITMTLSVYYLPKLSGIKVQTELNKEISSGQIIILPLVTLTAIIVYFSKDYLILFLFNDKFLAMRDLFLYQLLGDFFKIASWFYSYLLIAKARVSLFIWSEFIFSFLFIILSVFFVSQYGLVGMSYALALNYAIYFIFMYVWFLRACKNGEFNEVKKHDLNAT
jgi:PST family polysaccharide transporter